MDYKQFELQKGVRENCEDLRGTLSDLHKWEKEIKEKEKRQQIETAKNENIPIVRSNVAPEHQSIASVTSEKITNGIDAGIHNENKKDVISESPKKSEPSKKEIANIAKEKGNSLVKLGNYEEAIHHYTEAINNFSSDPIFYTNRALCFLKLEKYEKCVEDCTRAIKIDKKCIKAFYRRMQAYESLAEIDKSLTDCNQVLSLDPGNIEAKRSQDRIKRRRNSFGFNLSRSFQHIRDGTKITDPTWTQIDGYMKEIPIVTKPPHARSKKPLKRVPIDEILADEANRTEISDEIIDKLFNNNDCGSYKQVEPKEKEENRIETTNELVISESEKNKPKKKEKKSSHQIEIEPKQRKIEKIPETPKTHAQFYATWKELTSEQKYSYFKQIEAANVLKILGAGFETETLSEILFILSIYHIRDECDVSVIGEIGNHEEMSILAMFLSEDDRQALKKIITYMRQKNYDTDKISHVNKKFGVNY